MRFLKLIALALVASWLVFELVINLAALNASLTLQINLPWYPLGRLTMPVWLTMLGVFTAAFIVAVTLEIAAWYEYTRLIRLQRKQILALQKALGVRVPTPAPTSADQSSPSVN